ncbi:alternative ribosome rescue aminoacyl-tRNA hydrolase ArfB [Hephaestia mangrovi]|uniref:alternative ribosome rescue aminoacyl-tRNA hydrolase ArfB n=1 Tax=Hephaestia mangrovi TaxID=2873268 RepID=UPI001CA6E99B|nr:alternative ribosome rescue aminoacyl-tRNA hydrolase ArfB [Hephaestia mangrovi]MBY8826886.1 aminoacyl-tRNA hydrolase [Hephaestia mangrovi]
MVEIPEDVLEERFLASTGPGGQNVNKVATACQLRADVFRLGLAPDVYKRLKELAGSRLTASGELVITARRFRTQEANRQDARERLAELIAKAHHRPAKRRPTRPSKAAKARRVDAKKGRSAVKAGRGKVRLD